MARRLAHLLDCAPSPGELDFVIQRMRWLVGDLPLYIVSCFCLWRTVGRRRAGCLVRPPRVVVGLVPLEGIGSGTLLFARGWPWSPDNCGCAHLFGATHSASL